MKFDIPDFGEATLENAIFLNLQKLTRSDLARSQPIKLVDVEVGQRAFAVFQTGAGKTECWITRTE